MYKFTEQQKVKFDCGILNGEGRIIGVDCNSLLANKTNWIVAVDRLNSNLGAASEMVDNILQDSYPYSSVLVAERNITAV